MSLFRKILLALNLFLVLLCCAAGLSILYYSHGGVGEQSAASEHLWYLWGCLLAAVVIFVGMSYWIVQQLLKPLTQVTAQAQAICNQEFNIETTFPRTGELRQLTQAINNMLVKIRAVFIEQLNTTEKLRAQAYLDSLTNLGNRKFFNLKVKHLLASKDDFVGGYFLLVEVKDLKIFNDRYGFQKGDELIKTIAVVLEQQLPNKKLYLLSRIAGATFASILTDISEDALAHLSSNILHTLRQHLNAYESSTSINIGAVNYHYEMTLSQMLSGADHALRQSQYQGSFNYWINPTVAEQMMSAMQWHEIILHALNTDAFVIYSQAVKFPGNYDFHNEIYIKIKDNDNHLINAATFLPEAERFNLAIDLDKVVIKKIIKQIKNYPPTIPYALNLSVASLYDKAFNEWLWQQINTLSFAKRACLQFEVSESVIFNNIEHCEQLFKQIKNCGIKIGIDKVGANFLPIHYMHRLNINYLKIDGSFTHGIEQDKDKQFFIYNLCQAANTLGISVIGTNVETAIQWQLLQESLVQLGQGFYFEAPQIMYDTDEVLLKVVHG